MFDELSNCFIGENESLCFSDFVIVVFSFRFNICHWYILTLLHSLLALFSSFCLSKRVEKKC